MKKAGKGIQRIRFLTADAVYEMIEKELPVCLNECYVKDFHSLNSGNAGPSRTPPITLKKFFAKGRFLTRYIG